MFQIEEEAYALLHSALSGQWKKNELEEQIADRLEQKIGVGKLVITYPDVVDALYQLGLSATDFQGSAGSFFREKRLYRLPHDKMIAGICTGLGKYFEIDPVIMRVLFVVALFMFGIGFWLYILLWIVIPKAPFSLTS